MKESVNDSEPMVTASVHRHFRLVRTLWPDAKFLFSVRDGRDVAASWMNFGWHGNTWSAAHEWVALRDEWHALRTDLKKDQFSELRHEDIIDRPEDVIQETCRFLRVTYQPQMLEYHKHTSYAPLTKTRSQQWRNKLSVSEIRIFEIIAVSHLDQYSYPRSGEPEIFISNFMKLMLIIQNNFRCIHSRIREFGLRLWFMELVARRTGLEQMHNKILDDIDVRNHKFQAGVSVLPRLLALGLTFPCSRLAIRLGSQPSRNSHRREHLQKATL